MDINVVDNKFEYQLYDKRKAFNFKAVWFPFADSNMPNKIFYNTISTEVLRICRASSKYPTFKKHSIEFIKHMREQGAKLDKMKTSIDRLIRKHTNNFAKFEIDQNRMINELFSTQVL